ncbi:MAG TPA: glycogen debranching protein GlgX [Rhizomicrobium sp.]|jgi:glycogen operon protein|nr:glycogen debranching protein GlgX [Rhizomicrobium sp.]
MRGEKEFLPARLDGGLPYPLGASWDGMGVNFAVFSAHATRIQLCLFDALGRREAGRLDLPENSGDVWHGYLPHAQPGLVYGFRAHGPYEPQNGMRFNPHKLLLDPYARRLVGTLRWTDAVFGYRVQSPRGDLSFDRRDSAPAMVKAAVAEDGFHWGDDRRPATAWSDTVIYETHVRGMTKLFERVPEPERGTFAGLAHPLVIEHLKRLGVTAVELLPVHAYLQDRSLLEKKLANYWGYNTLAYFAPEPRYLSNGHANEVRMAVRSLHAAGIEVILDVVYNHTCEGNELGATLSWRGLDNASYYRLNADNRRYFVNDTGTGNTVNVAHPRVLQMVLDSLRYWAESFHVDGFRFDLGTTLGREENGFDPGAGFFDALRQDPVLSPLKLISEPWDIGPGGYQLGRQPNCFAEWNDRFRDSVRRYWRGESNMRPELASRLSGSADLFEHDGRKPWASINFVTSHDGMTLEDLVSYAGKHNEANGENSADGVAENYSANWGAEGETADADVRTLRARVKRSILMTLIGAFGTPMLLGGDEFGRTQKGNNNAYCQDNPVSWYDWTLLENEQGRELTPFVQELIRLRRTLARPHAFLHGREQIIPGIADIDWFDERGLRLSDEDWRNVDGRALILYISRRLDEHRAIVSALAMNASHETLDYHLLENVRWRMLLDGAAPKKEETTLHGPLYRIEARAAVILEGEYPA